ncbi:unnamed protein product [Larinioides sclopetarius]|uniref:Uncharacterized protein n=1 Tax=Larinioides sclopetarius TaxID=280406 RepID=A0AAV2BFQ4_9ARAC
MTCPLKFKSYTFEYMLKIDEEKQYVDNFGQNINPQDYTYTYFYDKISLASKQINDQLLFRVHHDTYVVGLFQYFVEVARLANFFESKGVVSAPELAVIKMAEVVFECQRVNATRGDPLTFYKKLDECARKLLE